MGFTALNLNYINYLTMVSIEYKNRLAFFFFFGHDHGYSLKKFFGDN